MFVLTYTAHRLPAREMKYTTRRKFQKTGTKYLPLATQLEMGSVLIMLLILEPFFFILKQHTDNGFCVQQNAHKTQYPRL